MRSQSKGGDTTHLFSQKKKMRFSPPASHQLFRSKFIFSATLHPQGDLPVEKQKGTLLSLIKGLTSLSGEPPPPALLRKHALTVLALVYGQHMHNNTRSTAPSYIQVCHPCIHSKQHARHCHGSVSDVAAQQCGYHTFSCPVRRPTPKSYTVNTLLINVCSPVSCNVV